MEDAAELVEPAVEGLVLLVLRIDPGSERARSIVKKGKKRKYTIRVYPKMWAPIAGKVGASAAEK